MNPQNISVWVGIITAIAVAGVGWGKNDQRITELEEKMDKQDTIKEQQIRMEERQKQIQQDVQEIKVLIQQVTQ